LITAILSFSGLVSSLEMQVITFSAVSLLSLVVLRKHARRLLDNRGKAFEYSEFVGETAMVIREIPVEGEGKIYYRGAEWKATSIHHALIAAGSKVVIVKTEGIVLVVEES